MIKPVFYIVFLLLSFHFKAQENLVPNGGFEEYINCPSLIDGFFIDVAKHWKSPTMGTPDYFNNCSTDFDSFLNQFYFSVPENYIGYQKAKNGNGYGGFLYTKTEFPDIPAIEETYSEYIQVQLIHPLVNGKWYNLTFYVSNADEYFCGNSVGALFSPIEINELHDHNLIYTPNFQSDLSDFFCDSTKWFLQSYDFEANGTEKFLIIGVFTLLFDSQTSDYNGNIISGPGLYGANQYLYIDDVSITEIPFEIPNVFTPNGDGINDSFFLNGLGSNYQLTILNRWGQKIFYTTTPEKEFWNGTVNGSENPEGTYFYILEKNKIKKTGLVQLIR